MIICDSDGCYEEATVIDEWCNYICERCMELEVEESSSSYEDYESISIEIRQDGDYE